MKIGTLLAYIISAFCIVYGVLSMRETDKPLAMVIVGLAGMLSIVIEQLLSLAKCRREQK